MDAVATLVPSVHPMRGWRTKEGIQSSLLLHGPSRPTLCHAQEEDGARRRGGGNGGRSHGITMGL